MIDSMDRMRLVPLRRQQKGSLAAIVGNLPELADGYPAIAKAFAAAVQADRFLSEVVSALEDEHPVTLVSGLPRVDRPDCLTAGFAELSGGLDLIAGEGDFVIEIREDPNLEPGRPSFQNAQDFFPHTDLSYSDEPPSKLLLHCVDTGSAIGGESQLCLVSDVIRALDEETKAWLRRPVFQFPTPSHYTGGQVPLAPIITGPPEDAEIRFREDALGAESRDAILATTRLSTAIADNVIELRLAPSEMLVIDNRRVLHGRTGFINRGGDGGRHINRAYARSRL